mgnify:CR=1 FL=1
MATLTVQTIAKTGLVPSLVAALSGDADTSDLFYNNGNTFLWVKNDDATNARTVTINSLVNCNQGFDHDVAVIVAHGTQALIGPFEASRFNSSAGIATVTYSSETGLTVAAVSLT